MRPINGRPADKSTEGESINYGTFGLRINRIPLFSPVVRFVGYSHIVGFALWLGYHICDIVGIVRPLIPARYFRYPAIYYVFRYFGREQLIDEIRNLVSAAFVDDKGGRG